MVSLFQFFLIFSVLLSLVIPYTTAASSDTCSDIATAVKKLQDSHCDVQLDTLCSTVKPSVVPTTSPVTSTGATATVTPTKSTSAPAVLPTEPSKPTTVAPVGPSTGDGVTAKHRVIYIGHKFSKGHLEEVIYKLIDAGYNRIILAFFVQRHEKYPGHDQFYDASSEWIDYDKAKRNKILAHAHSRGAKILLSAGGATENHHNLAENNDPSGSDWGAMAARKTLEGDFDGLDIDSENWQGGEFSGSGKGLQWLVDATKAARAGIGPNLELTHAPQGPYFSSGFSNGYKALHAQVGDLTDFYFIQYYNQGAQGYHTVDSTLTQSNWFPGSAVFELINDKQYPIPKEKVVLGKFITGNGSTGYFTADQMKEAICKINSKVGAVGGAGFWAYDLNEEAEVLAMGQAISVKC